MHTAIINALLDRLNALSHRERTAAALTAAILLMTGIYVFVLEPVVNQWLTVHQRAEAAETELRDLQSLVKHRDDIERDFTNLRDAVAIGPTEHALKVALLSEIDTLARNLGLAVASIKPTTVSEEGAFVRLAVELQVRCEAHTLLRLMQKMQESAHLLNTEALSLTVSPNDPPVTATLQISKLAKLEGTTP